MGFGMDRCGYGNSTGEGHGVSGKNQWLRNFSQPPRGVKLNKAKDDKWV